MKTWASLVLFVCCIPSIASGQQAEPGAGPPKFKLPNFGFDAVIVAQLKGQPGEETLTVTYPNYHQIPRRKTVTKYRTETRTRTVPVETSGGTVQVEQTYTVQVPYSEEIEVLEFVANDTATEDMSLESLHFYDIKGNAVDVPTLRQRLSRRTGTRTVTRSRSRPS